MACSAVSAIMQGLYLGSLQTTNPSFPNVFIRNPCLFKYLKTPDRNIQGDDSIFPTLEKGG